MNSFAKKFLKNDNLFYLSIAAFLIIAGSIYLIQEPLLINKNNDSNEPQLALKAEGLLPGVDYIIDLDTMKTVWVSDENSEVMGYSKEELLNENSNIGFSSHHYNKEKFMEQLLERVSNGKGEFEFLTHKKNGEDILFNLEYAILDYNDKGYLIGKFKSYRVPTEEEVKRFDAQNN